MKKFKLLFVEDEKLLRSLFEDSLTAYKDEYAGKYEFEIETVADYTQALNYFKNKPSPDLIVLDLRLPFGKDGKEETDLPETERGFNLLKMVKSDDKFKNCPVMVFTNFGDKETKDKAKSLGADKFLVKSDTLPHQFLKTILELVK